MSDMASYRGGKIEGIVETRTEILAIIEELYQSNLKRSNISQYEKGISRGVDITLNLIKTRIQEARE